MMSNEESLYICDVCHLVSNDERRFIYTNTGTYCGQCEE